ncbi:Peptidase-M48 domain-containing protein [Mycena venus]|uniref:Peptidase-M48 domain-containing protein n=1 Tax=Mycena venus TaxID=2733690 RepID=A0A8H7DD52_9AGAR|nr:Peptidase-M48 domain-containing protein [Mycena venus]
MRRVEMALRQLLFRSKPWFRSRTHGATRFYSLGPLSEGRRSFVDKISGTFLGWAAAGLAVGGFYYCHLETAPETGRRRFMAVSQEQERLLHHLVLQEALEKYRDKILPLHHPITQEVRRITRRIVSASNLGYLKEDMSDPEHPIVDCWSTLISEFFGTKISRPPLMDPNKEWVVLVIDDPKLDLAFSGPGLVCVSTGIMSITRDEDGLAAVIGHEIGHVIMRHSAEGFSQNRLLLPLRSLFYLLHIYLGILTLHVLHSLPHSRALEVEGKWSDMLAIKLMSRACYDPAAAPRCFEDLGKINHITEPTFLRTHPPSADRVAHLKALLPESYKIYKSNLECSQLEQMRARGILGRVKIDLRTGARHEVP